MATTIVTKKGSGAPAASDLVEGELAVDTTNGRLYTENSSAAVVELGSNPSGNITFGDNGKAIFGAGSDLQIYHDGSNSIINDAGTGTIRIQSGGTNQWEFNGVNFKGNDNRKIILGDSSDLQIYHDASDSVILDNGTGNLKIQADDLVLKNADGSKEYLKGTNGGSVRIRYNNTTVLETTSAGIDVTGTVTADGLTVQTASNEEDALLIKQSDGTEIGALRINNGSFLLKGKSASQPVQIQSHDGNEDIEIDPDGFIKFETAGSERMRIDSSGRVLIGQNSNTGSANADNLVVGTGSGNNGLTILSGGSNGGTLAFADSGADEDGFISFNHGSSFMQFGTAALERMRLDASGNLLVGTTNVNPAANNVTGHALKAGGLAEHANSGAVVMRLNRTDSDGDILQFYKGTSTVGSIASKDGDITIGTGDTGFRFIDGSDAISPHNISTNAGRDAAIDLGTSGGRFKDLHLSGVMAAGNGSATVPSVRGTDTNTGLFFPSGGVTAITRNGVEGCRLDANGNFLVGTTSASIYNDTSGNGIQLNGGSGQIVVAKQSSSASDPALWLNNTGVDGSIVTFAKDGTTVGSIGTTGGDLFIGTGDAGLWFQDGGNAIRPFRVDTQVGLDNSISLGVATSGRFDDAFIVNGVTTGSDGNDKQDVETLSDAEQRVAVACKGLLRKWRWKDAVEAKGDDARIHFGIIAQDLQAAFEAEGLDAGRYAMFMSDTWEDEETGEERTRLGVRYHELLAFIIAAL